MDSPTAGKDNNSNNSNSDREDNGKDTSHNREFSDNERKVDEFNRAKYSDYQTAASDIDNKVKPDSSVTAPDIDNKVKPDPLVTVSNIDSKVEPDSHANVKAPILEIKSDQLTDKIIDVDTTMVPERPKIDLKMVEDLKNLYFSSKRPQSKRREPVAVIKPETKDAANPVAHYDNLPNRFPTASDFNTADSFRRGKIGYAGERKLFYFDGEAMGFPAEREGNTIKLITKLAYSIDICLRTYSARISVESSKQQFYMEIYLPSIDKGIGSSIINELGIRYNNLSGFIKDNDDTYGFYIAEDKLRIYYHIGFGNVMELPASEFWRVLFLSADFPNMSIEDIKFSVGEQFKYSHRQEFPWRKWLNSALKPIAIERIFQRTRSRIMQVEVVPSLATSVYSNCPISSYNSNPVTINYNLITNNINNIKSIKESDFSKDILSLLANTEVNYSKVDRNELRRFLRDDLHCKYDCNATKEELEGKIYEYINNYRKGTLFNNNKVRPYCDHNKSIN